MMVRVIAGFLGKFWRFLKWKLGWKVFPHTLSGMPWNPIWHKFSQFFFQKLEFWGPKPVKNRFFVIPRRASECEFSKLALFRAQEHITLEKWYETHATTCKKILWISFGQKSEVAFFDFFLFSLEFGDFITRVYAHIKAYKKLNKTVLLVFNPTHKLEPKNIILKISAL